MTAQLENLEISGNLKAGREMSGKLGKCRKKHSHRKLFIPNFTFGAMPVFSYLINARVLYC